jgi:phospholipid/cholesterol/gamma-HCH transport system ATP-binding protein
METPQHPVQAVESGGNPFAPGTLAMEMVDVTVGSMKFTERVMLEGVNWTVRVSEFWAVGGLQATGKSDLLAAAAGLMRPLRGSYKVFGRELAAGYEQELLEARLRVGLVFDGGRLLQHLTIGDNILLPLRYHQNLPEAQLQEQLKQLLEFMGLTRHSGSYPDALGLNWQQRAGLARALCLRPDVLLLDNPLTGLDPLHTGWWLEVLDQLSAGHPLLQHHPLTLVVTTDDLRLWQNHARQFAVLKENRFFPLELKPGGSAPDDSLLAELVGQGARPVEHKGDQLPKKS